MKFIKIDENGLFIEDVLLNEQPTVMQEVMSEEDGTIQEIQVPDPLFISTPCQGGLYLPKWNGMQWIEGKTGEEITALTGTENELSIEERMDRLELIALQMEGVI